MSKLYGWFSLSYARYKYEKHDIPPLLAYTIDGDMVVYTDIIFDEGRPAYNPPDLVFIGILKSSGQPKFMTKEQYAEWDGDPFLGKKNSHSTYLIEHSHL
jgi:hypothetical protein